MHRAGWPESNEQNFNSADIFYQMMPFTCLSFFFLDPILGPYGLCMWDDAFDDMMNSTATAPPNQD